MLLRSYALGLSAALLLQAGVARADEPQDNASRAAAAQSLFEDAVRLMEAGKFGEACPKLAASEKLDPGAGTLLNLGTCYEKNGQTASAWATFIEAEAVATRAGHPDWAGRARDHSEKIAPHLPRLTIVIPKEAMTQGLTITRDGVPLDEGAWGTAIPLDPGPHEVSASAPQKKPWSSHVDLKGDEPPVTVTVQALEDVPLPPPPPPVVTDVPLHEEPAPPAPPVFWTTGRAIGTAVGAVGVAGLGIGIALVAVAKSQYDDASGRCPNGLCSAQSDVDQGANAHHLADAATGMLIGGGIFVVAGGAVVLLGGPGNATSHASALQGHSGPGKVSWRLTPNVGPHVAGALFEGAW